MINETLQKLGLSDKETSVYLSVLKQGKITPAAIGRLTGINRTTVYSVAKDLIKKGLIAEDLASNPTQLVARPPQDLDYLINEELKAVEEKKKLVASAIEQLQSTLKDSALPIPKIVFIQEAELEDYLYKRTEEWHKNIMSQDGILWGFQDHTFAEHYEKWIDWEWQVKAPAGMSLRLLSNKSPVEEKLKGKGYSKRQIKYWNKSGEFTASVWVHGDYLLMVMTRQHPFYLVEIHDALLAKNMRELFKGIWDEIAS